jgi:hypothetical protein
VETVVDAGMPVGFLAPDTEGFVQRLSLGLGGEVDNGSGAAECRSDGAGGKIVARTCIAERHIEVRVDVDAAGNNEFPRSVDGAVGIEMQIGFDAGDSLSVDEQVGDHVSVGGNDPAVSDKRSHSVSFREEKVRNSWARSEKSKIMNSGLHFVFMWEHGDIVKTLQLLLYPHNRYTFVRTVEGGRSNAALFQHFLHVVIEERKIFAAERLADTSTILVAKILHQHFQRAAPPAASIAVDDLEYAKRGGKLYLSECFI